MTSPWAKLQPVEAANLEDIMSEEVARDMQAKENKKYEDEISSHQSTVEDFEVFADAPSDDEPIDDVCESDAVIALMLQKQFDKEYYEILKRSEHKPNSSKKVTISFKNYRRSEEYEPDSDTEEEECVDIMDRKDWDRFDKVGKCISAIPRCGYMKDENGAMITKHDSTLTGRNNACKLLSFPPEFQTGDGASFDLQLSNKVFNSLKAHSNKTQTRRNRLHDKKEDHATAVFGVDEFTKLLLYKLINKQLLERVNGVISTGKEAVILHADSDPAYTECALPKECVIKVFKTTLSEYKQRDRYIKDDHRFKDRYGKQNSRRNVQLWAEKEMANLMRVHKIGIPCPEVVTLKSHILVMSFIGKNHRPAPKLKDARLKPVDLQMAYEQVIDAMIKLYTEAKLIHADLSEYNILWYENQCWFIDVSQAVEPTHPNAFHFLFRDCSNICTFFSKRGVPDVKEPKDLFMDITGYDFNDKNALPAYGSDAKPKPHHIDMPEKHNSNRFDHEWESSKLNDLAAKKIVTDTGNLQLVDALVA